MDNKKSYYAIIPANVRYDKELPANAKLLYGEITALCNERGYCWASNQYFADLYDSSVRSVQLWLKALEKKEHIYIKYEMAEGSSNTKRYISLVAEFHGDMKKLSPPHEENFTSPHEKNFTHNNTVTNNTKNNTSIPSESHELTEALNAFAEHRKKLKKPMTDYAKKLLLSKLKKLGRTEEEQIAILNQSIENGWQGIFALKHDSSGKTEVKAKPMGNGVYKVSSFSGGEDVWKPTKIIR